ncbi:VPS64 Vacuolar sorting [Paramyrothecium foliicola]|nr:VPS64 Vacuolar sorting [Paramyrothecium foliicola]
MTAVANPPTFPQISRPAWGTISGNNPMNPDEVRGMFVPRKTLPRSNSSSSISSNSSVSSNTTVATNGSQSNGTALSTASDLSQWSANSAPRKRPQPKSVWPAGKPDGQPDFSRMPGGRPNGMVASHGPLQQVPGQPQMAPQQMMRLPPSEPQFPPGQPVLFLLSLNGTFERKTIPVPFAPDNVRIGRQTNMKMVPTPTNGFFDSKVLSRQHAEIFAERNGKVYIRDVKSSNGTFVNGTRLSQENRESEPHELQTGDHLELGIDIVSEDQKTVVHHKVAAKVEHAGFLNPSSNVLDMNFGDLDPANNAMMIPPGAMQMRGRAGSNASMASNGRMMPNGQGMNVQPNGMPSQRPFFLTPIATDQILKKLANEMRNARLQAQDLGRTNQFVNTLLSKDDIRDIDKSEPAELLKQQQQMLNGAGLPFRPDPKTRFSEPPAPPPQQPLPEKPDVPALKRGPTERPKGAVSNTSPVRQDNLSQIIQLTEALNNAKRDIDSQTARMRELEDMLQKEREAREIAERVAQQLEDSASTMHMNGSAKPLSEDEAEPVPEADQAPPTDDEEQTLKAPVEHDDSETIAARQAAEALQSRIDTMEDQMRLIKEQMEQWKQRCEVAESERDADRKTLAEMVVQLRAEEARRVAEQERARSRSRKRRTSSRRSRGEAPIAVDQETDNSNTISQTDGPTSSEDATEEDMLLSRANTITPLNSRNTSTLQEHRLEAGLPYASMLGVVLIGMGLMAYINGWQSPPPRIER